VIERVIFTGDFLRPLDGADGLGQSGKAAFRPSQTENIAWFHRLMRRRLAEATGLGCEVRAWGNGIDTPLLYRLLELDRSISGWAEACSMLEVPAEAVRHIESVFRASLVISFELPESVKRILSHLRIPFVDVVIHPARFLPDVFFAIQTNRAEIFHAMQAHDMPGASVRDWADLLSASAVRLPQPAMPRDTALLIGQTNVDRSLISAGVLQNFGHHAEKLRSLLQSRDQILFKPHPYNQTPFGLYDIGLPHRALHWTSTNVYALLAQENVDQVIGISSSVLIEAGFFGKQAIMLGKSPFDFAEGSREPHPGQHLSIYDACFETDFWRDALAPVLPVTRRCGTRFRRPPNTLRLSLRNFWGYNEITTDFLVELHRTGRA
jgi:hypothetical protein